LQHKDFGNSELALPPEPTRPRRLSIIVVEPFTVKARRRTLNIISPLDGSFHAVSRSTK
jgi:hypothetical protein